MGAVPEHTGAALPEGAELRGPSFWRATWALTRRWVWRLRREPVDLAAAVVQPVIWLVLFGQLFSRGIIDTGGHGYVAFLTAGVLTMTVYSATWNGGVELLFDRESGILQRMLAAPIAPGALVVSRGIYVLTLVVVQVLVILGTAWLMGVRVVSGLEGVAIILTTGLLLGTGIVALSFALAFGLRGHTSFFSISSLLGLPLIFTSNALVSLEQMPVWLQMAARINPLTYAISVIRQTVLVGVEWSLVATMWAFMSVFVLAAMGVAALVIRRTQWAGR